MKNSPEQIESPISSATNTREKIDSLNELAWNLRDSNEARALELAGTIANNAGNSVAAAKHIVNLIMDGTRAETAATRAMFDGAFNSPEFAEGARAFVEKRTPRFR